MLSVLLREISVAILATLVARSSALSSGALLVHTHCCCGCSTRTNSEARSTPAATAEERVRAGEMQEAKEEGESEDKK